VVVAAGRAGAGTSELTASFRGVCALHKLAESDAHKSKVGTRPMPEHAAWKSKTKADSRHDADMRERRDPSPAASQSELVARRRSLHFIILLILKILSILSANGNRSHQRRRHF
jgi:hypothetical protein